MHDMALSRRRKCQSARQQPPQIGARAEARLAWPDPASSSGHLCRPSRSQHPRVAAPRAPVLLVDDLRPASHALLELAFEIGVIHP
jgi:hypothetical protein